MRQVFPACELAIDDHPRVASVSLNQDFLEGEAESGIVIAGDDENVRRDGFSRVLNGTKDRGGCRINRLLESRIPV
jgi:hypothetical protein